MRSLFVARIVMVLFCLLFPTRLVAQDELRIILVDLGSPELARKVRAEATQAGFVVAESSNGGQALALVTVRSEERVAITIERRGDEPPFAQELLRRAAEGDSFPLRVIEQLRARLIELEIVDESRFGPALPSAQPEAEPAPEPPAQPKPAPAPPPRAEPAAPANQAPRKEERQRFWLRAGAAATLPSGGIGVTPQAALGLAYESSSGLGLGLRALLPLTNNQVTAAEGDAEVNVNLFVATLDYAPLSNDWFGAGVGGGVLHLALQAQPNPSYVGDEDRLTSGVLFANLIAGHPLSNWLRLRATLLGGASVPRPVLRFAGREAAAWGRWFGALALELEATLPAGGGS